MSKSDQEQLQHLVQNLVAVDRRLREVSTLSKNLRRSKGELESDVIVFMKDSDLEKIELRDGVSLQLLKRSRRRSVNLADVKGWLASRYRMSESDVNHLLDRLKEGIAPQTSEKLEFKFPSKSRKKESK